MAVEPGWTTRDVGMEGLIITAKHHDGFCLWPVPWPLASDNLERSVTRSEVRPAHAAYDRNGRSLVEPLQVAMDDGAKRALIPIDNKRQFLEVSADVLERVDPVFYGDLRQAAFKALGLN